MSFKMMRLLTGAALAGLPVSMATAQISFEFLGGGDVFATHVSADGSVVVGGVNSTQGVFRWTQGTGVVDLGRGPALGGFPGAGFPMVSNDGTKVSGTILGTGGTYTTAGVWTQGSGWTELMPPTLPDGGTLDNSYGSGWGISGDGQAASGLYWRPGQPGGLAHAFRWTAGAGLQDLGSSGNSSRGTGINNDGSVVVGFDEDPTGPRRAAIWENGLMTLLNTNPSEAIRVNGDGSVVVGEAPGVDDFGNSLPAAAFWSKSGGVWTEQVLGVMPGTDGFDFGMSSANDVNADGSVIVGFNRFGFFGGSTGWFWTQGTGMVNINTYLADHGVNLGGFNIDTLTGVSDDGRVFVGSGFDFSNGQLRSFRITVPEPSSLLILGLGALALVRRRG